jgi:uncharacterized protein involved in exopolysaccharide biosynthesis
MEFHEAMYARAPQNGIHPVSRIGTGVASADPGFWSVLRAHVQLIALTTLIAVLLTAVYVVSVRSQYAATAEVMLDTRKSSVEDTASVLSNLPADQTTILNQIEILTSYRLAAKVVDAFHLDSDPEFSSEGISSWLFASATDPRETAIRNLRARLKVAQAGFSSSIRITLSSYDKSKAERIVAGVASMYVQAQLDMKAAASRQASRWLTQRIAELSRKANEAEGAVEKFKSDHNITTTASGNTVIQQQIADLNSQLTLARTDYDDKEAKAERVDELVKLGRAGSAPEIVSLPLIANLRTQESDLNRQIAQLATQLGPKHPKMIELSGQLAGLEAKIAQEIQRVAESVRNDADTANVHVRSLQQRLHEIETLNAQQDRQGADLASLQSAAASARSMYQTFLSQYGQTENQQGILRPDATVISTSEVAETFGPQIKLLMVLSAIPTGLLLGVLLAFLKNGIDRSSEGYAGAEARSGHVAVLPAAKAGYLAADLVATAPQSPFAVAISQILESLLPQIPRPGTIVVTSSAPRAGNAVLALALARAAANAGLRTIAIDADYPHQLENLISSARSNPGVPAVGAALNSLDDFVKADPLSPALVMTADRRMTGYESIPDASVLARLIVNLKKNTDLLIITSPAHGDRSITGLGDMLLIAADDATAAQIVPSRSDKPTLTVLTQAQSAS